MDLYKNNLARIIFDNIDKQYYDNYDTEIRKPDKKLSYKIYIENIGNRFLKKFNKNITFNLLHKNLFWEHIDKYEYLYNLLSDNRSKKILLELIAYKLLGFNKIKLTLNNGYYWRLRNLASLLKLKEKISVNFREKYLYLFNLEPIGFDLNIYYVVNGILNDFILEQYNYRNAIKVLKGDIVIDAGGCWGDTALYFSSLGAERVYTFEFIKSNIDILKMNIDLNSKLKNKIMIIDKALWDVSDMQMSYQDSGPSSKVAFENVYNNSVSTISIDDFVKNEKINRIDFIKMDIEGAELQALKGAATTIDKFKPKMTIAVYHKFDDLYRIPKIISSIRNDYRFYLDYYTIIADEIILYAI